MSKRRDMNEGAKSSAIRVMNELMRRPLSRSFHAPFDVDGPNGERYLAVIKNPQDLSSIRQRLKQGHYMWVEDWIADIETVWSNSEAFHEDEVHADVANECRRIFEAILRKSGVYPIGGWCTDVFALEGRLEQDTHAAPLKHKHVLVSKQRRRDAPADEEDVEAVVESFESLRPSDKVEIALLLSESGEVEGVGESEMWIDISRLKASAVEKMKEFMHSVLE